MLGPESRCARTREVSRWAGEVSGGCLGFEGSRPRRPFRLSVRTTTEKRAGVRQGERGPGKGLPAQAVHPGARSTPKYEELEPPRTQGTLQRSPLSQGRQVDWRRGRTEGPGTPSPVAHQDRCLGQRGGASACPTLLWPTSVPRGLSQPPTFLHHAHGQALLEAAELAAVSPPLVHRAVLVSQADVLGIFLHCALGGGNTEQAVRAWGGVGWGGQGRGRSRSYCHRRQKHSLFTTIFLTFGWQGRIRWMGWGRKKKSLGDTGGGFSHILRTQDEGRGAPQQPRH